MKYLLPNQANQTLNLTLAEGRSYYATAFTHYLMVIEQENTGATTENKLAQVLVVNYENTRNTEVTLTTVGLDYPETGGPYLYRYTVYGQNSTSNLDPENAAVVGVVERGNIMISDNGEYYLTNTDTTNDVIYPPAR